MHLKMFVEREGSDNSFVAQARIGDGTVGSGDQAQTLRLVAFSFFCGGWLHFSLDWPLTHHTSEKGERAGLQALRSFLFLIDDRSYWSL
jgi:hypothetical protein